MARFESLDSRFEGGAQGREPDEQDGEDKVEVVVAYTSVAGGCASGLRSGPGRITTTSSLSGDAPSRVLGRNGVSGNIERWKGTGVERKWSETSQSSAAAKNRLDFLHDADCTS